MTWDRILLACPMSADTVLTQSVRICQTSLSITLAMDKLNLFLTLSVTDRTAIRLSLRLWFSGSRRVILQTPITSAKPYIILRVRCSIRLNVGISWPVAELKSSHYSKLDVHLWAGRAPQYPPHMMHRQQGTFVLVQSRSCFVHVVWTLCKLGSEPVRVVVHAVDRILVLLQ